MVARDEEDPLSLYWLPDDWSGQRWRTSWGWDRWELVHQLRGTENFILVGTQRRAIHHQGPKPGLPRVIGRARLIKFDALVGMLLARDERARHHRPADSADSRANVNALYAMANQVVDDDSLWSRAGLTVEGRQVEAVEITLEQWWLIVAMDLAGLSHIYAFGSPATRPDPLTLERVSADAYPVWTPDA
jgi:hypothetical protein